MPRKKKIDEESVEVKKVVKVKPKTAVKKTAVKKSTVKKTAKPEPVKTAKFSNLDDISVDEFEKVFKDRVRAEKVVQLIKDYSFEKNQTERVRCVSIAFGNWRYGAEFDPAIGSKDNFELHNFEKCKNILESLLT